MNSAAQIISDIRDSTGNEDFSDTRGIPDREILKWLNHAQDRLVALIQREFPDVFQDEVIIDAVFGQEAYDLPADTFLGTRVDMVEFSASRRPSDYYYIKKASKRERTSGFTADPSFYIRRGKQILLQPHPDRAGLIRITYQKTLPRLDIARGTVLSVSLDTANRTINSLSLDPSVLLDDENLLAENQITIVDRYGIQQMRRIPIDSIDTGTGAVTVTAGFTYEEGETISVDDTALRGKNSSTHSELPDNCERYLHEYGEWNALRRDSSTDSAETSQELIAVEQDIVESFRVPDADVPTIAILDDQFLSADGES